MTEHFAPLYYQDHWAHGTVAQAARSDMSYGECKCAKNNPPQAILNLSPFASFLMKVDTHYVFFLFLLTNCKPISEMLSLSLGLICHPQSTVWKPELRSH